MERIHVQLNHPALALGVVAIAVGRRWRDLGWTIGVDALLLAGGDQGRGAGHMRGAETVPCPVLQHADAVDDRVHAAEQRRPERGVGEIGEIRPDGQFDVVWKTKGPVVADPWSDYIAENKGKKNVPEKK